MIVDFAAMWATVLYFAPSCGPLTGHPGTASASTSCSASSTHNYHPPTNETCSNMPTIHSLLQPWAYIS